MTQNPSLHDAARKVFQDHDQLRAHEKNMAAMQARFQRYADEDAAHAKATAEARERHRREAVDAAEAELKALYRTRFLATPGSRDSDFERAWPDMLRQIQLDQTMSGASPHEELLQVMRSRHAGRVP